jgi:NADPH-dependent 2,4-dienoyl-CoA reductase/sulfur reductase-like enzyme
VKLWSRPSSRSRTCCSHARRHRDDQGRHASRLYPGAGPIWVKLVAHAEAGHLLGGQIVGVEGAAKRIDVLAGAIWTSIAVHELEMLDIGYAPPFCGVYDPR